MSIITCGFDPFVSDLVTVVTVMVTCLHGNTALTEVGFANESIHQHAVTLSADLDGLTQHFL